METQKETSNARGGSAAGQDLVGEIRTTNIETADSLLERAVGVGLRRSIPDDYALIFRWDAADRRRIHTLWVPFELRTVWLVGDHVAWNEVIPGGTWGMCEKADTVVECHPDLLADLGVGDPLIVRDDVIYGPKR